MNELNELKGQLAALNEGMKDKLQLLNEILNGKGILQTEPKVLFPVIEVAERSDSSFILGALDSLTIKIIKTKEKDKFILVPSESEKDKKLEQQIIRSWLKAKEFCKKYVRKISEHHEIIISFDQHLGIYKGESVGTAIVVGFIGELLRFYNSQTVLKPISGTAFTGGIKERGEINSVSKEIIEKKVEIVFFSNCSTLVIPKEDESFALYKLYELRKAFPARELAIVGVKDISEILLRRDLVDIKKQKLVVRTGKFVIKNWAGAVFAVLLTMLLTDIFALDFDDNPAVIENKGTSLLIKNKNGKILWTRKLWIYLDDQFQYMLSNLAKCIDINADGINEILICHDDFNDGAYEEGRISCYDHKGNPIWKYSVKDTIRTIHDVHSTTYSIGMVQNTHQAYDSVIYCYVSNHPLFPSAIFRLSARTGKRLDEGLWNAGHIVNAMIGDFNKDDKLEIVAFGVHNGFNSAILFSVDPDSLNGQTPSIGDYLFTDLPKVVLRSLISFLPCDLTKYHNIRMNAAVGSTLMFDHGSEEFRFLIHEGIDTDCRSVHYRFDRNLKFLSVSPGNGFEAERDLLIREGKLSPPKTNTEDYTRMLENNILYWKNYNWVKREELE